MSCGTIPDAEQPPFTNLPCQAVGARAVRPSERRASGAGGPGAGGPGRFFSDFFGVSGPEGRETPVNGQRAPELLIMGSRFLSSASVGKSCVLPLRMPNPSPTLDKNLASMGPGVLASIRVGVWRNRSGAFPDSSTIWTQKRYHKETV